jgi:hypothetical protein
MPAGVQEQINTRTIEDIDLFGTYVNFVMDKREDVSIWQLARFGTPDTRGHGQKVGVYVFWNKKVFVIFLLSF